jgi:hypothetical protein
VGFVSLNACLHKKQPSTDFTWTIILSCSRDQNDLDLRITLLGKESPWAIRLQRWVYGFLAFQKARYRHVYQLVIKQKPLWYLCRLLLKIIVLSFKKTILIITYLIADPNKVACLSRNCSLMYRNIMCHFVRRF